MTFLAWSAAHMSLLEDVQMLSCAAAPQAYMTSGNQETSSPVQMWSRRVPGYVHAQTCVHRQLATDQHLLVFCDNLGILSAAVSGRSSVLDVNCLLTGLHLLLTSLRVSSWCEHVDTHANPADGGSRQGTSCKLAKRLGIPLEWVKFLFVPACMAAAGPTEWLKFFKTFA